MALLLPLLCIPHIIKTQNASKKKPFLVIAPREEKKSEAAVQKMGKSDKSKSKSSPSASESKKNDKKIFSISDSFRTKEHHNPGTLGYKHWTGWYYPTKFILSINGAEVINFDGKEFTRPNKEISCNPQEPLKIRFVWEFLHGRRHGWRSTDFKLDPAAKSIDLDFDWKDEWQVKIAQAKPIPESDKSNKSHEDK